MLRRELRHLQIDDNETAEFEVIEQQIDVEIIFTDNQVELASYERKARAQFDQESLNMIDQSRFQVSFDGIVVQSQKVEQVRIF